MIVNLNTRRIGTIRTYPINEVSRVVKIQNIDAVLVAREAESPLAEAIGVIHQDFIERRLEAQADFYFARISRFDISPKIVLAVPG